MEINWRPLKRWLKNRLPLALFANLKARDSLSDMKTAVIIFCHIVKIKEKKLWGIKTNQKNKIGLFPVSNLNICSLLGVVKLLTVCHLCGIQILSKWCICHRSYNFGFSCGTNTVELMKLKPFKLILHC